MKKQSLKTESTWKIEQDKPCWKFLTFGQKSTINYASQQSKTEKSTVDVCWCKLMTRGTMCADVSWWREALMCADVARCKPNQGSGRTMIDACSPYGLLVARGSAWTACSWARNLRRHVWARVQWFQVVLSWVLLEIDQSVTLCLCFSSLINRMMRFERCRVMGETAVTCF